MLPVLMTQLLMLLYTRWWLTAGIQLGVGQFCFGQRAGEQDAGAGARAGAGMVHQGLQGLNRGKKKKAVDWSERARTATRVGRESLMLRLMVVEMRE